MNKFSTPLRYGAIGFMVMCIISFVSYFFYRQLFGSFYTQIATGLLFFGISIFIPIWGGIGFRREQGGVISFKDAFLAVFMIYAISSLGGSVMQYLIPNVIDTEYPEQILNLVKTTTEESMEKFGAPDDQIEKTMQGFTLEQFKPSLFQTAKAYGGYMLFGAILSLIIAAFIKRNSEVKPVQEFPSS